MQNTNNYSYEAALGRIPNTAIVNKWGYNTDVDTAVEEVIASFGGAFNPVSAIMTVSQTFTITYNGTTDGAATTGALSLFFTYLDGNFKEQFALHTLGGDGSDVTAFTGLGINRVVVLSNGGLGHNVNDITITATTDTTNQAQIPALSSVTQQCIYHVPIGKTILLDFIFINVLKLAGQGGSPKVSVFIYSWSRVTLTNYAIGEIDIDTDVENTVSLNPKQPFIITGREVVYLTSLTDSNNTKVNARFSGVMQDS